MRHVSKLTDAERSEIQILHDKSYSARQIASVLGCSPNTIAAELKRNSYKDGHYTAVQAKHKAYVRRRYARYQGEKIQEDNELRSFVIAKLSEHWNPDEITGYLKAHPKKGIYASKTAIYEWLHSAWDQRYCVLLYSRRYRRKPRKNNKTNRVMIPARVSVWERPEAALDRHEVGHNEYDSIASSKRSGSTAALAVAVECSTRLVRAQLVPNLRPRPYAAMITQLLRGQAVQTLTTDNGIENKQHQLITKKTRVPVFFTDPYSSWQKGGVENTNKMLRRYLPEGTDFATASQTDAVHALAYINNKPRKILGYKSSLEVAKVKGLILD